MSVWQNMNLITHITGFSSIPTSGIRYLASDYFVVLYISTQNGCHKTGIFRRNITLKTNHLNVVIKWWLSLIIPKALLHITYVVCDNESRRRCKGEVNMSRTCMCVKYSVCLFCTTYSISSNFSANVMITNFLCLSQSRTWNFVHILHGLFVFNWLRTVFYTLFNIHGLKFQMLNYYSTLLIKVTYMYIFSL
jgi:hypothetical protein